MSDEQLVHDGLAWVWNDQARRETGATYVPAGKSSGWWAHALTPHVVTSWLLDDGDDPEVFAAAFGSDWVAESAAHLSEGGVQRVSPDTSRLPAPRVDDRWARLVVVRSLARWFPEPINESALRVDEALAWSAVGDSARASTAMTVGVASLASIAELLWDDAGSQDALVLPEFVEALVDQATTLALRLLPPADEDVERLERLLQSRDRTRTTQPSSLVAEVERWLTTRTALVAGHASGTPLAVLPISPATVTPRVLRWCRPPDPGFSIGQNGDEITIMAPLAPGVVDDEAKPRTFVAFLADDETGALVSGTPLEVNDSGTGMIGALRAPEMHKVAVGVVELDLLDALRVGKWAPELASLARLEVGRLVAMRAHVLAQTIGTSSADSVTLAAAAAEVDRGCVEGIWELLHVIESADGVDADTRDEFLRLASRALTPISAGTVFAPTIAEALITVTLHDAGGAN